jgi:tRNA (guanine37-N1)-methyltransferase
MRIDVITIFPDYLAPLHMSLLGKAQERGLIDVVTHDLRTWTSDPHRTVDDTPYGGGPGMVMRPEPWGRALDDVAPRHVAPPPLFVVPTPAGRPFTQALAAELVSEPWLLFGCGRYEGIDGRVVDEARTRMRVLEVTLGDYVLSGGEAAVLVIVEAVVRLLPGVVGNAASLLDESHAADSGGLLEAPVFTKPASWRGHDVPGVLLSGHHGAIARWRRDQALRRTAANRPDLLRRLDPARLDRRDLEVLAEEGQSLTSP